MFQPSQPNPILPPVQGQSGYITSPIDWYGKVCPQCWGRHASFAPKDAKPDTLTLLRDDYPHSPDRWKLCSICPECRRWERLQQAEPYFPLGLARKTKSWWNEFRVMVFETQPQHIAEHIYRANRKRFYEARTEFSWKRQFPPFEVGLLCEILREIEADFDCVDNERVADKSKKRQRKRFWKQAETGCCGSHYEEVELNGKTYMVGFNYGH